MAAPCGNKTSRGHACYPLTTYCPNRPATYKRDTTGRPAESAIYKPDIQPKPRPHAYTHAYTGTPARPHPRKTHCTHPHPLTTAPKPSKSQVMSKRGIKSVRNRPNNTPSAHNPCFSTIQAICAPQQHPCATSDMHTHANTSTHTETQHANTSTQTPRTTYRARPDAHPRTPEKRCHRPAAALG